MNNHLDTPTALDEIRAEHAFVHADHGQNHLSVRTRLTSALAAVTSHTVSGTVLDVCPISAECCWDCPWIDCDPD